MNVNRPYVYSRAFDTREAVESDVREPTTAHVPFPGFCYGATAADAYATVVHPRFPAYSPSMYLSCLSPSQVPQVTIPGAGTGAVPPPPEDPPRAESVAACSATYVSCDADAAATSSSSSARRAFALAVHMPWSWASSRNRVPPATPSASLRDASSMSSVDLSATAPVNYGTVLAIASTFAARSLRAVSYDSTATSNTATPVASSRATVPVNVPWSDEKPVRVGQKRAGFPYLLVVSALLIGPSGRFLCGLDCTCS